jgi:hypothetical protein
VNHNESQGEPSLAAQRYDPGRKTMPKSITIHGLEDRISRRIEEKARAEGRSLNRTIKILLEEAIEPKAGGAAARREVYSEFLGVWKQHDMEEFASATADLRRIDEEAWR